MSLSPLIAAALLTAFSLGVSLLALFRALNGGSGPVIAQAHDFTGQQDTELLQLAGTLPLSPAVVEVYQELGNIFRQRGDIERAIAIRQLIINNSGISQPDRLDAYYAMGLDYRHAGLFNRALDTFIELLNLEPRHSDAGRQLVYLYEEVREWDKAFAARKRVDRVLNKTSPTVLAHYKTEQGKELAAKNPALAEVSLGQAIRYNRLCLDAYLHLGDLYLKQKRMRKAFDIWRKAAEIDPSCAHLIMARLEHFKNQDEAGKALTEIFADLPERHPLFLLQLAKWRLKQQQPHKALELLEQALAKAPGFMAAHDLRGQILLSQQADPEAMRQAYQSLLEQIKDSHSTSYRCEHCGFTSYYLSWHCPRCRHWDSISVLAY